MMQSVPSILFVCMGNICRSPTAEIIWSSKLKESTKFATVPNHSDSAGTIAYHNGNPPDSRMQRALKQAGYQPFGVSRKITTEDFDRFDLILAMDRENLFNIKELAQSAGKRSDHCHLFLDYADVHEMEEVPDPYYGGDSGFVKVIQLVEKGCDNILKKIASDNQ